MSLQMRKREAEKQRQNGLNDPGELTKLSGNLLD
jgi:hypothetical protein